MRQTGYDKECAHPNSAVSLSNLVQVYHDQGKHEKELKMHVKCVEMRDAMYGKECENPDIATCRSNLA